jgi:hypothetical protein
MVIENNFHLFKLSGLFGFSFPLVFFLAFTITFCSFHCKMVMDSFKILAFYGLMVLTLEVGDICEGMRMGFIIS